MKRCLTAVLMILLIMEAAFSSVAVRIYSKQEGLNETSISKPRIYIRNIGTEAVSNFYYYYYFKVENGMTPFVEPYYTPDCAVTLENKGNGLYAVKFSYNSISLQPGQILPNPDGNVIGVHYSDWSTFLKENDPSFVSSDVFVQNQNIPVYKSDGTLISGNYFPPSAPPVPPKVDASYGSYAVLSKSYTDIRDNAQIKDGFVGSSQYVEVGCDAVVNGSIISGGNVVLRDRANISGDVSLSGTLIKQNSIIIGGTVRQNAETNFPEISSYPVIYGANDITVADNASYDLTPGNYKDFHAFSNSIIRIWPGNYKFKTFIAEPGVKLILKPGDGQKTSIDVSDNIRFADRDTMRFESGDPKPLSIRIFSAQSGLLSIGTDGIIYGMISAPMAELHVYSRTKVFGILNGDRVIVEPQASVCKPPVLVDLWHSEWAFGPSFDPLQLDYTAVVPDATVSVIVKPVTLPGLAVKVNGRSGDSTAYLNASSTKVPIEVSSQDNCGITLYNLLFAKASRYMIYVNDNSPCSPGNEDGNSWQTAFKDLQKALDYATSGKEIWVAEGKYKPSKRTDSLDARSATFQIKSGIEIKGGFKGTESDSVPTGSPYNTILSGDISGNDDSISVWPPSVSDKKYLSDNVYHVITTSGNSKSIHIYGLVIQSGAANGSGYNKVGAGILNKNGSPTIEYCGILKNYSDSSGAGIYDEGGFTSVVNCLFKNNVSSKGNGSGLFIKSTKTIKIDASVFDGNATKDTSSLSGGAALYISGASTEIVNSIFTRNIANGKGGAIFNNGSILKVTNCTFYNNSAVKGAGGINNQLAKDTIVNTILWDTNIEISDTISNVTYSCIKGGYPGVGNFTSDPLFVNANKPEGNDSIWGSLDDGLVLQSTSSCIDRGIKNGSIPTIDILFTERESPDIGAYEYFVAQTSDKTFGYIDPNGFFVADGAINVIDQIYHWWYVSIYAQSNYAAVAQVLIKKDKYTSSKFTIYSYLYSLDNNGNEIYSLSPVRIELFKVGERNGMLVFQTQTSSQGKPMVFVNDETYHNWNNNWAYVVCAKSSNFKAVTPGSQF
jgi:hypothetical protein